MNIGPTYKMGPRYHFKTNIMEMEKSQRHKRARARNMVQAQLCPHEGHDLGSLMEEMGMNSRCIGRS